MHLKQNRTLDTMPNECSVKYPDVATVSYETDYVISIDPALGEDHSACVTFDRKTGKIVSKEDLQRELSVKIERKILDRVHAAYGLEPKIVDGEIIEPQRSLMDNMAWLANNSPTNADDVIKDYQAIEGECAEVKEQKMIGHDEI